MWRLILGALAGLVALVAMSATPATSQSASEVSCGDTIRADTILVGDLVGCPNNGIVIGADGITLDLNGHLIEGDGTPFADCRRGQFCDTGVLNHGHSGVTVRKGSVRQFGAGVFVGRARGNRVLGVSSSSNQFFGFVITDSVRSLVRDSAGNGNPGPDGDGIGVFASHDIRILQSSFGRNALGMHVADSTDIVINRNRFSRNSGPGILIEADRNQVRGNRCVRNEGECILVASASRNVIARNRVFRGGGGISIEKGRGNVVARNVVVRTRFAGIRLTGADNVVRGNLIRGGRDGILVTKDDRNSLLRSNTAIAARDDGFDVRSRSTTLRGNRAVRSADLGIDAVPGVVDGGGNVARRSGDPRRCTNVSCG